MATAEITFTVDPAGLRALLEGRDGPVWDAVRRKGNQVLNLAVAKCPVDEGRLRASLTLEMRSVDGLPIARVGSNLSYARFVHDGTGLHGPNHALIRPVSASVLRWPVKNNSGARRYSGGRTAAYAYARYTRGMRGRPFLLDALREAR